MKIQSVAVTTCNENFIVVLLPSRNAITISLILRVRWTHYMPFNVLLLLVVWKWCQHEVHIMVTPSQIEWSSPSSYSRSGSLSYKLLILMSNFMCELHLFSYQCTDINESNHTDTIQIKNNIYGQLPQEDVVLHITGWWYLIKTLLWNIH